VQVTTTIETFLGKLTIMSLDRSKSRGDGSVLLRIEGIESDDIMSKTMGMIREVCPRANILQYGLRGVEGVAIMEFAIERGSVVGEGGEDDDNDGVSKLMNELDSREVILAVTEVNDDATT